MFHTWFFEFIQVNTIMIIKKHESLIFKNEKKNKKLIRLNNLWTLILSKYKKN